MELCAPGSKGHNRAAGVRGSINRCSLVHTGAANRIGTEHVAACDVEQVDFASKPAVYIIGSKRANGRAVTRDGGGAAEPEIRPGEVYNLGIGHAVPCIHVEIEAAYCEHRPVAGDWIKYVPGARACHAEYDLGATHTKDSGSIVLCHQG
jgi:hypothetical protein